MKTKTINVYKYSELNDKAKEKARAWFLEGNDIQFGWDCMKDDAKNVGIELTEYDYRRTMKGELTLDFTQVMANILKEHGEQCETWKTAKEYQEKYTAVKQKPENDDEIDAELETLEEEFLNAILEDYRVLMDQDVDYRETEEYIAEMMEANEYEFDENGRRV